MPNKGNNIAKTPKMGGKILDKATLFLVLGTWGLVIISSISTALLKCDSEKQLREAKKATELTWRPFLIIEYNEPQYGMSFRLGETAEEDTLIRGFEEISLDSPEYLAVKTVGYVSRRKTCYKNTGATPLRITHELVSTISQFQWEQTYSKSPEKLINDIHTFSEYKSLETDVIIMPADSSVSNKFKGISRRMDKKLFEQYIFKDSTVILYPYIYVEYEDLFNHKYNAFLIENLILKFNIQNNIIGEPEPPMGKIEKYRWDIPYES